MAKSGAAYGAAFVITIPVVLNPTVFLPSKDDLNEMYWVGFCDYYKYPN
jgi:hypothetical protein